MFVKIAPDSWGLCREGARQSQCGTTAVCLACLLVATAVGSEAGPRKPIPADDAASGLRGLLVYDNSVNCPGRYDGNIGGGTKLGDVVTLEGTARFVTRMEFLLRPGETPWTTVRLAIRHANDDPVSWYPGVPIWRSPCRLIALPEGEETLVTFHVPRVRVPQTFVWTLEFPYMPPMASVAQLAFCGPATVGDDDPTGVGRWYFTPLTLDWRFTAIGGSSFYCRIYAVHLPFPDEITPRDERPGFRDNK